MTDQTTTIPKGWKITTLGEVVDLAQGVAINAKTDFVLCGKDEGLPLLKINNLLNETVDMYANPNLVTKKAILKKEDVIFTRTGQVGWVFTGKEGILHNNSFKVIPHENIDGKFLYWFLKQRLIFDYVQRVASGSAQPDLNHDAFKTISIALPTVLEQRAIAAVLSSLDDKIELLREQNKTLEATAWEIFKEWFVDFNFPGATGKMIDSELGEIPEGWMVGKIKDEIKTVLGGTPSRSNDSYWENGSISWINSGAINNFPIMEATEYITEDGLNNSAAKLMPPKTVVLPFVITPGSEIKISILGVESSGNQSVLGLLETNRFPCGYIYLWIQNMKNKLYSGATGGAQQHINKQEVDELELLIPEESMLIKFSAISGPIFEKIIQNSFQVQNLSILRDTLLPKLMKGDIRVKGFRE